MDSENKGETRSYSRLEDLTIDCVVMLGLLLAEFRERNIKPNETNTRLIKDLYERLEGQGIVDRMLNS